MARIDVTPIKNFELLQSKLPDILQAYGIKQTYVLKKMGMAGTTFRARVKNKSFTAGEMRAIADILNHGGNRSNN